MDFQKDIEQAVEALHNGGLILYPTDTIWGIGCDATNAVAVQKIFALKKRSGTKGMIVLMTDEREVLKYTTQPDLRVFEFLKSVPRPTTVIYEGAIGLAHNLIGADGTAAIRLVKDRFCRHLIKRFRKPVVSTSANFSEKPSPKYFAEVSEEIKRAVDYVVRFRQDDDTIGKPSAIVKWNKDGVPAFIRT
ncbi:MAG TPA: L-threonylcarbamoyladenylate synthase [Puia sp.]|nr:L-threonylcarbamoyladenylate synthase [Puia sp.]